MAWIKSDSLFRLPLPPPRSTDKTAEGSTNNGAESSTNNVKLQTDALDSTITDADDISSDDVGKQ